MAACLQKQRHSYPWAVSAVEVQVNVTEMQRQTQAMDRGGAVSGRIYAFYWFYIFAPIPNQSQSPADSCFWVLAPHQYRAAYWLASERCLRRRSGGTGSH